MRVVCGESIERYHEGVFSSSCFGLLGEENQMLKSPCKVLSVMTKNCWPGLVLGHSFANSGPV